MNRVVFARIHNDSRTRYSGNLPLSDSVPLSSDTSYQQLKKQFAPSGNKGNMIIGESVGRLFRIDPVHSCNLDILELSALGWSPARIAQEFNERFDYVIFAMANAIRPHMGRYHEQPAKVVPLLKNKVIVLGIGKHEPLPYDFNVLDPATLRLLWAFNEHASVFGVRGHSTEEWLHTMKIDRAQTLGCPSLYLFPNHITNITDPGSLSSETSIITAGNLHIGHRTRPLLPLFKDRRAHYIMQDEVFQPNIRNAFKPHMDFYNDVTGEFDKAVINKAFEGIVKAKLPFHGYWYFQSPDTWRSFCARHTLFVGDRFHGGVAALQSGLPAVIFWGDSRVNELTNFFGIPNIGISELGNKTLDELVAEYLSKDQIAAFQASYRQRFDTFRRIMEEAGLPLAVKLRSDSNTTTPTFSSKKCWTRLIGNSEPAAAGTVIS